MGDLPALVVLSARKWQVFESLASIVRTREGG